MIDYSENEGVCANAGPHSQKLHDRVTNICRNRMRQQSRSAMEPPQHEATSCQIDVVTSRQVSMSFTAVFHYNNSWNCLLLACSRTHTFSQMNPCLIRLFAVTPGLGPGKFKLKINKYNFQALFLVYCTNHLFGQEITRKESKNAMLPHNRGILWLSLKIAQNGKDGRNVMHLSSWKIMQFHLFAS